MNNQDNFEQFLNMPNYHNINTFLLSKIMLEKYDKETFENIKQLSSIHKLTYKNSKKNVVSNSYLNYLLKNY